MYSSTFRALINEAQFTSDILGAGATQIRQGNYAKKGLYFQAFTSLSTGLERIGKLCLMLDYYLDNNSKFPDFKFLKNNIGHDLELLYQKSQEVIKKRNLNLNWMNKFDDPIRLNIISILSTFAKGDRYSNINILVNAKQQGDPIAAWFEKVDLPLFDERVSSKKKDRISHNARVFEALTARFTSVNHTSETGTHIDSVLEASFRSGLEEAVLPYRQLYILQIIRYWVVILWELQMLAMVNGGNEDIPHFSEIFATFYNEDRYFKSRKTWDNF
ncbi:hypothetical protein [Alteromonas lipotrueiana]|uniref:hypothetical protein n=1 Tax=Alteromonas lipotrueiana TaxID=2803815 RepID=UPI001C464EFF|nr:hypothetical protein [Alteromonas lipotrueiana]